MRPVNFLEGLTSDLFIKTKKYTNLKSKKKKKDLHWTGVLNNSAYK